MGSSQSVSPDTKSVSRDTKSVRPDIKSVPPVTKSVPTESALVTELKKRHIRRSEVTQEQIKKLLNAGGDDGIITTHLEVSLRCPLGKMRMSIPCRASTCSHVQCFDASVYIRMNRANPKWKCPVCNQPASYKDLIIDEYFQKILNSDKLSPGVNNIQLLIDGSWKNMVDETPATQNLDEIELLTGKIHTIDLMGSPPPQSGSQKEVVIIDLTSDTYDDALSRHNRRMLMFDRAILDIRRRIIQRRPQSNCTCSEPELIIID